MVELCVHRMVSCGTHHTWIWRGLRRLGWGLGPSRDAADRSALRQAQADDDEITREDLERAREVR